MMICLFHNHPSVQSDPQKNKQFRRAWAQKPLGAKSRPPTFITRAAHDFSPATGQFQGVQDIKYRPDRGAKATP